MLQIERFYIELHTQVRQHGLIPPMFPVIAEIRQPTRSARRIRTNPGVSAESNPLLQELESRSTLPDRKRCLDLWRLPILFRITIHVDKTIAVRPTGLTPPARTQNPRQHPVVSQTPVNETLRECFERIPVSSHVPINHNFIGMFLECLQNDKWFPRPIPIANRWFFVRIDKPCLEKFPLVPG